MHLMMAYRNFIEDKKLYGLSERTIDDYAKFLKTFIDFIGEKRSVESVSDSDIKGYIASLYSRKLAKATIATYTRHVKVFLNWASDDYELCCHINKIPMPKVPKRNVYIYSPDDIKVIFDTIESSPEWIAMRNRLAVALMLDSGLRRNEVCNVRTDNLNIAEGFLTVIGKGDKQRTVPLGKLSRMLIERYREQCPFDTSGFLLVGRRGERFTNNALKLFVSKLSERLPFPFSCHKLRHNFATNYCLDMYEEHGRMDAYSLQIMLGHSDLQTTMRYIHHAQEIVASKASLSHMDKVAWEWMSEG